MTPLKKQIYDLLFKHRDFIKNSLSPFELYEMLDSLVRIDSIGKSTLLQKPNNIDEEGREIMRFSFNISAEATWYYSYGGTAGMERFVNTEQIKDFEKIRLLQAFEKNGQK